MYEIYADHKNLYYPGDHINIVSAAAITEELNDSGYVEITVPQTNPLHGSFCERKTIVEIKKNNVVIWDGEVRSVKQNIKKDEKVYAVGSMSYLQDSLQPSAVYEAQTPVQLLGKLINEHNAQVEEKKRFQVGIVTIDVPGNLLSITTDYNDTLSVIRNNMCSPYNGYLKVRMQDNIRYLDLVKIDDYGKTCEQPIQFGMNLLDYVKNADGIDIVTCVVPIGRDADGNAITIESVNNGLNYIYDKEAVDNFGWIRRKLEIDNVSEPNALLEAAREWLIARQYSKLTIETKAVDLSTVKENMESFELGDYVNAKATPFGLNAWYYIRKKKTDILNPANNTITIGSTTTKAYTELENEKYEAVKKVIPSATDIINSAKQNATNLILAATNGNIYMVNDGNGNPKELLIMDTKDIETAKKVWRWNINGLGYSQNGYNGPYGMALTMDGHFVADAITVDGLVVGKNVTMGENAVISWAQVKGTDDVAQKSDIPTNNKQLENGAGYTTMSTVESKGYQTAAQVTQITKDTVTTEFVNALKITAGSVAAENITGTKITGKMISGGSISIGNNFSVDTSGNLTASGAKITGNGSLEFSYSNYYMKLNYNCIQFGYGLSSPTYNTVITNDKVQVYKTYIDRDTLHCSKYTTSAGNCTDITGDEIVLTGTITTNKMCISASKAQWDSYSGIYYLTDYSDKELVAISKDKLNISPSILVIGNASGKLGFFGSTGMTKRSVSSISSTSSATTATIASKVNEIIDALKAYNLVG